MFLVKEGSSNTDDDTFIELKISETDIETKDKRPLFKYFHLDKNAATWIYKNDVTERPLIYWAIDNFANKDKNFIDIGAHLGIYTWTFAKYSNHVYSFECNPKSFCYLAANVALHDVVDNVSLFSNALGNNEDTLDYIIRNDEGGENGFITKNADDSQCKRKQIKVSKLDSFNLTNIGLIKIDVEGFEKEVLEGAAETLKNNNYPPIIFESWAESRTNIDNVKELRYNLFSYFNSIGYNICEISGGYGEIFLATKNL